jgi:hypothetical protein
MLSDSTKIRMIVEVCIQKQAESFDFRSCDILRLLKFSQKNELEKTFFVLMFWILNIDEPQQELVTS